MHRAWRRSAALAGLIGSAFAVHAAAAPAAFETASPAAVRLLAPAGGAVLPAGAVAELAWEPLPPFDRHGEVEEWEAFLSLDGGAHYTVRITPHLDLALRRILWQVPAAPTTDARLLLRFGDEHLETVFELPQRFAIAGSPLRGDMAPATLSLARGEAARPGQAGVVAWVEGRRSGGAARAVVAAELPSAWAPRSLSADSGGEAVGEAPRPPRDPRDPDTASGALRQDLGAPGQAGAATAERPVAAAPVPILLLTTRQNE